MKVHKLVRNDTRQISPAREKLRGLLAQRAASEQRVASLRTAEQRLTDTLSEAVLAAKALTDFDHESSAATLAWAKNALAKDGAPQVDTDRRQALLIAKAVAAENAAAANAAKTQLAADIHAESRTSQNLQPAIEEAVAEILFEVASGPLIEDLLDAQRAVVEKQTRLHQAMRIIVDMAHAGPAGNPIFGLFPELDKRFRKTAPPAPEAGSVFAQRAAWDSLATHLRSGDVAAELEA